MNAEALIGTVLGTCMLQKLIGQGGMGAVFLAQQSRPRRQVAVKVLLPVSSQSPHQQAAFLERFRRETDAAALLEHPNIVPVHEYGERDGLAYLVMPYISGGTLRDEMESEELFPLAKAMSHLDQMAAALDFAHEHGVIHRDIKPANILMTPERRLLLTDFGLVKVITDAQGQTPNSRLTAVGVPMGTPDYMAPEQVLGLEVDSRADLYSLGVILFQMVTGKTPFLGEMPMQIAMQHLHTPVPSPRIYRPDLPIAAEQVLLRSLAKRPADRYANASDFANAFRLALTVAGVALGDTQMGIPVPGMVQEQRSFTRRSLFDPMWQGGNGPADSVVPKSGLLRQMPPAQANPAPVPPIAEQGHRNDIVAKTSMTMPSFSGFFETPTRAVPQVSAFMADGQPVHMTPLPESVFPQNALPVAQELPPTAFPQNNSASLHGLRFGKRSLLRSNDPAEAASAFAAVQNQVALPANSGMPPAMLAAMGSQADVPIAQAEQTPVEAPQPGHPKTLAGLHGSYSEAPWQSALSAASPEFSHALSTENQAAQAQIQNPPEEQQRSASVTRALNNTSTLLSSTNDAQGTGMIKLTQAMKLVKVPVAGKPGTYMTGLLPMSPEVQEAISSQQTPEVVSFLRKNLKKLVMVALALLIVLIGTGTIVAITHKSSNISQSNSPSAANLSAAATSNAIATAQAANIIVEDSLSTNIHSWKETSAGNLSYVFKNGKYHVSVNNGEGAALADLPEEIMPDSFVFSVDASEIKGDDTSVNNQFGLVFRLNQSQKNGQPWVTFYCFQVQNTQNDVEYQLRKYDSSYADDAEKWSTPWHVNAGKEFQFGHGAAGNNSFKLMVKSGNFTFIVNGKTVGTFKDTSFKAGRVGFLVNQKGTEVAFSNLLLTNN